VTANWAFEAHFSPIDLRSFDLATRMKLGERQKAASRRHACVMFGVLFKWMAIDKLELR
jgi:hypothetical protein